MKNIKALLFDFDGTIVDSESFHCECWNRILEKYNVSISVDEYLEHHAGMTSPINAKLIKNKFNLDVDADFLISEKERISGVLLKTHEMQLMKHAREVIDFFYEKNFILALVTGSTKSNVYTTLKKIELYDKFKVIITRNDVKVSKPDPACYNECIKRLNISKEECIAIEDTLNGLRSAKAAGLFCCIVGGGINKNDQFKDADIIFEDLNDVKEWVLSMNNE